jgi:hypothetical protein
LRREFGVGLPLPVQLQQAAAAFLERHDALQRLQAAHREPHRGLPRCLPDKQPTARRPPPARRRFPLQRIPGKAARLRPETIGQLQGDRRASAAAHSRRTAQKIGQRQQIERDCRRVREIALRQPRQHRPGIIAGRKLPGPPEHLTDQAIRDPPRPGRVNIQYRLAGKEQF